ncbi:hypothetical protein HC766_00700 [Candidatus Gracilibacteria bacterium]|nr:hypothetical protein [Candidatus Gracilibacteria bacterium]
MLSFVNVNAAEFQNGDEVEVNQTASNLYVTGGKVTVDAPIQKDLVAAGGQVSVKSGIERNGNIAGGQVDVDVNRVGGTLRVAGGQVTISGVIQEDLVVAGGQVTISDATINGDLVVGTGDLTITNTIVNGDFYGSYDEYSGEEISTFVAGEIMLDEAVERKADGEEAKKMARGFGFGLVGLKEITSIAGLIILLFLLNKRNRIHIPTLKLDGGAMKDLLIGLGIIVLFPIVFVFLVWFFFPALIPLAMIIYGLLFLSSLFLPIYAGNLVKNTLNLKMKTLNVVLLTYVVFLLIHFIAIYLPFVGILGIVVNILALMNFGFVIKNYY